MSDLTDAQSLFNNMQKVLQQGIKKTSGMYLIPARIVSVSTDLNTASAVLATDGTTILNGLKNKTGEILNYNDEVYIYCINSLTNAFIGLRKGSNVPLNNTRITVLETQNTETQNFITATYPADKALIQAQIDGSITSWFYNYDPTLVNLPSSDWNTDILKNTHLGDLFYNTTTGYAYRFALVSTVYQWIKITDTDVTTALANASKAQDTADSKRRVFVTTPIPPYDIGDLWSGGTAGDLKKCVTAKTTGQTYNVADWGLATKYTDDTYANSLASQTLNYRTSGSPTNPPVPAGLTIIQNTNASINIKIMWNTYVQGTIKADYLILFWKKGINPLGSPTINDSNIMVSANTTSPSYYMFEGVNPADNYTFGIAAARKTENGIEIGNIASINGDSTFTRNSIAYKSDGTQVASGQPRLENGGVLIEEGTTNLCLYDSEGAKPSSMSSDGTGTQVVVSSEQAYTGVNSIKWTYGSSGSTNLYLNGSNFTQTPSTSFTASFKVKRSDSGVISGLSAYLYVSNNSNVNGACTIRPLSNGWYQVSYTRTSLVSGAVNLIGLSGFDAAYSYYIDSWQVEAKPYPTSYVFGTRQPETLTLPTVGVLNASEGTFETSILIPYDYTYAGYDLIDIRTTADAANRFLIFRKSPNLSNSYEMFIRNGANWSTLQFTLTSGVKHSLGWTWKNGSNYSICLDGTPIKTGVYTTGDSSFDKIVFSGGIINYTDLCISSIARTDADILARATATEFVQDGYTTYKILGVLGGITGLDWQDITSGEPNYVGKLNGTPVDSVLGNITLAQTDASNALSKLSDIASDSKLTPDEKQSTQKEWNVIVSEKTSLDAQADLYSITTEKTNYDTSYNILNAYISPLLIDLTTTSDIVATTFRGNFKDYYDKKLALINKIANITKGIADGAQGTANTALNNAATAQTAATNAQTSATTANNLLTDIADDNKLTPDEKQSTKKEWDSIVSEVVLNDAQATTFGITTEKTSYDNAYSALNTYIIPLLSSLTTTTVITGTTFRSTFKTYYDARTTLLNAIAVKAKTLADSAQTTANNIQVGGRNLIVNSKINETSSAYGFGSRSLTINLVAGATYIFTVNGRVDAQAIADTKTLQCYIYENTWTHSSMNFPISSTTDTTQSTMFTPNWTGAYNVSFYLYPSGGSRLGTATVNWAKLEQGNKATDWTPAPEDVQALIDTAQTSANTANAAITDMSSDDKISPVEKISLKTLWDAIVSEKSILDTQGSNYSITTELASYDSAYNILNTYLNTTYTVFTDITTTTSLGAGGGVTLRNNFSGYYIAKINLQNKIPNIVNNIANSALTTATTTANNFNNRNDRKSTTPANPTTAIDGTCIDHIINTDSTADISFEWIFNGTGDAYNIDGFIIYVYSSSSSPAYTFGTTVASEQTFYAPFDKRAFILYGATSNNYYTFGVQSYRIVDPDINSAGIIKSSIIKSTYTGENPYQPSSSVAFSGNITGTIIGTSATTVVNTANTALTNANNAQTSLNTATDILYKDILKVKMYQTGLNFDINAWSDGISDSTGLNGTSSGWVLDNGAFRRLDNTLQLGNAKGTAFADASVGSPFTPDAAFDGNTSTTMWEAPNTGSGHYLGINFGQTLQWKKIIYTPYYTYGYPDSKLQYWNGTAWQDISGASWLGTSWSSSNPQTYVNSSIISTSQLRLLQTSTAPVNYWGVYEMALYETDVSYSNATLIWNPVTSTGTLSKIIVEAVQTLNSGTITYYVSRDNGTNYTACNLDTVTDISYQPTGTSIVLKAIITGNAQLLSVAWGGEV